MLKNFSTIALNLLGWKIEGYTDLPDRHIYIGYPHTAIWDTPIGALIGFTTRKQFLIAVKESFDKPILRDICKRFNLLPIQRNAFGLKKLINTMQKNKDLNLMVAIEGTRKKTKGIKPGFFVIAKRLNIPIVLGIMNWQNKTFTFVGPFNIEETYEATVEKIAVILEPMRPLGKYPENESPIKPL